MTDHRISLARLTAGGMLVLAAFGAFAQDVSRSTNPNPFQRPGTANQAASDAAPATVTPSASAPAVENQQMPLTLPPAIPLPPPGVAYPALVLPKPSATAVKPALPALPVPDLAEDTGKGKSAAPVKQSGSDAPAKPRAFLAREKIEANRARCQVSFKGRTLVQLPAGDTEQVIQVTGANGCLTAMSADTDWLDVQYVGNNELIISAIANDENTSRRGQVTVVTPNQTFVLTVRQAAEAPVKLVPVAPAAVMPTASSTSVAPASKPLAVKTVPVAPVAPVEEPVESEAARARMAEDLPKVLDVSISERLFNTSTASISAPALSNIPVQSFALPEVEETPFPTISLVARELSVPVIKADELAKLTLPTIELPEVKEELKPIVLPSFASKEIVVKASEKEQLTPAVQKAITALPDVQVAAPKEEPKLATMPPAPSTTEKQTQAVDPSRARSVLQAMLGAGSAASPTSAKPAAAKVSGVEKKSVEAKPATKPAAKSMAIPDGYVTLDEYDLVVPARK